MNPDEFRKSLQKGHKTASLQKQVPKIFCRKLFSSYLCTGAQTMRRLKKTKRTPLYYSRMKQYGYIPATQPSAQTADGGRRSPMTDIAALPARENPYKNTAKNLCMCGFCINTQ